MLKLAEIKIYTDGGPWAYHNYPCPVCLEKKAVLDMKTNIFLPCWSCQKKGFFTFKLPRWLSRILKKCN